MNGLDFAYGVGGVLLAPIWARKIRGGWAARFGRVAALPAKQPGRARVLIHAVSVGEVNALRGLVALVRERCEVVVASTTDTGLARAQELFGKTNHVVRYPLDFSWAVARFLDAVAPDAVALVELEVWPNFVKACQRRGVPVGVINGRLSERSFKGYRRIRRIIGPSFERLAFAAVQDEAYRARFEAMGVARERVMVTGTMKWDSAKIERSVAGAEELAASMGIDRSRPLVVAGSTGPEEEAMLHRACLSIGGGVQLLCAPRKPERFDEAARAMGAGVVRRSVVKAGGAKAVDSAAATASGRDRFLLDTIGELRAAYSLADVAVVGRSFGKLFGSDPIEPVSLHKATIMGPRFKDFESVVRALRDAGGLGIVRAETLSSEMRRLLDDAGAREKMAQAGTRCIAEHVGATKRHAELIAGMAAAGSTGGRKVSGE